jgi:hypothetical protein
MTSFNPALGPSSLSWRWLIGSATYIARRTDDSALELAAFEAARSLLLRSLIPSSLAALFMGIQLCDGTSNPVMSYLEEEPAPSSAKEIV